MTGLIQDPIVIHSSIQLIGGYFFRLSKIISIVVLNHRQDSRKGQKIGDRAVKGVLRLAGVLELS